MTTLLVRDLESRDIPLLDTYWQTLTIGDLVRMFIDRSKLPSSEEFVARLNQVITTPIKERQADPLIWELNGQAVGFTNLNNIERGKQAEIHLHIVDPSVRGQGLGQQWFALSLKKYFQRHQVEKIICQPAASNPGPNGLMKALGISPTRVYTTTPSPICFEHEVARYEIYGFGVPAETIEELGSNGEN